MPSFFSNKHTLAVACRYSLILISLGGCLSETSFPVRIDEIVYVQRTPDNAPRTTRAWLRHTHARLRTLLPADRRPTLLTEDLTDARGRAVDVFAHFRKWPGYLHTILGNFSGLADTARVTGSTTAIEQPAPSWSGFTDVWIPINDELKLSGRLGFATRDGEILSADCIVIMPGLFGDNIRLRARDIGQALRSAGLHVLALEFRGHGQTEARYPNVYFNFGAREAGDLLAVSDWLEALPKVRHTGIIGFSWSSNIALMAAWEDGREDDDPSVSLRLAPYLRPRCGRTHFQAGILAMSPVLRFEELVDALDRPWPYADNPVLATLQATVDDRARRKNHPDVHGNIHKLIEYEFERSGLNYPGATQDGYDYIRFLPYHGRPSGHKLQKARVPVLIIHGANDPLAFAQEIADFFEETTNPDVAGLILHGGGHDGFASYCRDYLYSMMFNFFDPVLGAAACQEEGTMVRREETPPPIGYEAITDVE